MTKEEKIKIIKEFGEKRIRAAFERSGYSHNEDNYSSFREGFMHGDFFRRTMNKKNNLGD